MGTCVLVNEVHWGGFLQCAYILMRIWVFWQSVYEWEIRTSTSVPVMGFTSIESNHWMILQAGNDGFGPTLCECQVR
jgi:hypothetical protein